jgi:hypothetical protein
MASALAPHRLCVGASLWSRISHHFGVSFLDSVSDWRTSGDITARLVLSAGALLAIHVFF